MAISGLGAVEIRVSPEVLITQAEEVRRLGNKMRAHFQEIEEIIKRTQYYWIGEAGELHRNLYVGQKENVDAMLKRLLEHPDDLLKISQNYTSGEKTNIATTQMLQTDIIQ